MRENDSEPGYLLQGGMIFWEHHSFQQVTREGLRKIWTQHTRPAMIAPQSTGSG